MATTRSWEEARKDKVKSSPGAFSGGMTLLTPEFQPSGHQNCERINCLKPPNLWYFIKAAITNTLSYKSLFILILGFTIIRGTDGGNTRFLIIMDKF